MNRRMILYLMLKLVQVEGVLMLLPTLVSYYYKEESGHMFLLCSIGMLLAGTLLSLKKPVNHAIFAKEGIVIVALSWIVWSILGAIPFTLTGAIPNYVDALFETISGFTTTGATILPEIESLPRGILFWRSFTHWIGGMGVLVFAMSILPLAKDRAMHLMRAEVPGPTVDKLVPKMQSTAKILYGIYIALTILLIILLVAGGMPLYDSTLNAFSTAGTGGFSIKNNSIAFYNSAYVDGVLATFMIIFGINFNLFYLLLLKNIRSVFHNEELRMYLGIVACSIGLITIVIIPLYKTPLHAFRYAYFQVASIISTTGFVTADYELWPTVVHAILILLMVIGGCGGSTSGGIKVSRVIVAFKSIKREMKHMIHPRSINVVKLDGKKVKDETRHGIALYIMFYVIIICVSVLLVSFNNFDYTTTFTAVIACISNTGPGLGGAGPIESFYNFSIFSKIVLCANMLIGRLDIFPVILLFTPGVWKKKYYH